MYGLNLDSNHPEVKHVLGQVAKRNPGLCIGGYHVDTLIMGAYKALMSEDLSTDQVYTRIDEILAVAYAGLL